jgi:hypothetical protein
MVYELCKNKTCRTGFPSLRSKGGVARATERGAGVVKSMLLKTKYFNKYYSKRITPGAITTPVYFLRNKRPLLGKEGKLVQRAEKLRASYCANPE